MTPKDHTSGTDDVSRCCALRQRLFVSASGIAVAALAMTIGCCGSFVQSAAEDASRATQE